MAEMLSLCCGRNGQTGRFDNTGVIVALSDRFLRVPLLWSAWVLGDAVPAVDFRAVRAMVSMAEVLRLLDYPLPLAEADRMRGPCPVHRSNSSKSRTFSVHLKRNVFHCFRCGSAGSHLDLYAAVTRQRLYQAAIALCEQLDRPIPWLATSG